MSSLSPSLSVILWFWLFNRWKCSYQQQKLGSLCLPEATFHFNLVSDFASQTWTLPCCLLRLRCLHIFSNPFSLYPVCSASLPGAAVRTRTGVHMGCLHLRQLPDPLYHTVAARFIQFLNILTENTSCGHLTNELFYVVTRWKCSEVASALCFAALCVGNSPHIPEAVSEQMHSCPNCGVPRLKTADGQHCFAHRWGLMFKALKGIKFCKSWAIRSMASE